MTDINTLRILATLAAFATFIGIAAWAFYKPHAKRFEEAARLPFEQD
jgi:cytochrome c oxidase cbb3-type subunit IV